MGRSAGLGSCLRTSNSLRGVERARSAPGTRSHQSCLRTSNSLRGVERLSTGLVPARLPRGLRTSNSLRGVERQEEFSDFGYVHHLSKNI